MDFKTYGITDELVQALHKIGITKPTPIQALAIPKALEGHDILASAQTGTGKTFAYLIPILQKLLDSKTSKALILIPTRELANQIKSSLIDLLGKEFSSHIAVLIGGEPMSKQFDQLKRNPRIIIGTPGRLNDHLQRKTLKLDNTEYLVLDETDRMLDMGFSEQIDNLFQYLKQKCQTFMFSATIPNHIIKISQKYLDNPEKISVDADQKLIAKITQEIIRVSSGDKFSILIKELEKRAGSVIIFVKTKMGADKLTDLLHAQKHSVDTLHGGLSQRHRTRVIQAFRNNKFVILVATDVAARGLDVSHIQHVINYDVPESPEDYIHRIGRTGRAGAEGFALCFVSPDQNHKWNMINRALKIDNSSAMEDSYPRNNRNDRPKRDYQQRDYAPRGDYPRSDRPRSNYQRDDSRPARTGQFKKPSRGF